MQWLIKGIQINIQMIIKNLVVIGSGSMGIEIVEIPETFSLSSAYPNPFNPTTNMTLGLDSDGQVSMMVYNLVGQVVDVLVDGDLT